MGLIISSANINVGQPYKASLGLSESEFVGPTVTWYSVIQFEGFVERVMTRRKETLKCVRGLIA